MKFNNAIRSKSLDVPNPKQCEIKLFKQEVIAQKTAGKKGRSNTDINPDLAFVIVGPNSRLPDRRALKNFPTSQH